MTSYRAPRSRRLAAAVVAAAGVGLALPAHASAALEPVGHALPVPASAPAAPATADTAAPLSAYHPLARFTGYASAGRVSPGHWVNVAVAGRDGVPAAGGFNALATTIIVSHATSPTSVAVSAPSTPTSTRVLTAQRSRTTSRLALAPVGAAGITRFRLAGGHARVQVLVQGYQQAGSTGTSFHPLAPANVLSAHRVTGGHSRLVRIVGSARTGLPSNGHVAAVALAVTVSRPTATTTVTANATGTSTSSGPVVVTAHRGTTTSGLAIVPLGGHSTLRLHNAHGHATLSAQVEGYWTTDPTGSFSRAVTPTIVYDDTTAANAWRTVQVASQPGLPRASQISAAVLSITTASAAGPSYLTVAPTRAGFPTSGPVAIPAHSSSTSVVVSRLTGSSVHVYANRRMRLTIRVVGYYGPTAPGTDVSSSCSGSLASGSHFAIIQATDGKPYSTVDPSCFGTELTAAKQLPAAPEFYLNLADPGKSSAGHWNDGGPKACHVSKNYDLGCAYDYGYQAAKQAVGFATGQGVAAGSRWWVDVETDNSWGNRHLTDPPAHVPANIADIEGALHYLSAHGYPAGVYTETLWWDAITDSSKAFSKVPVWGGGADSAANARANCKQVSITGGPALLSQWFVKKSLDHDVAC